jgi:hypothetical protein
VLLLELVEFHPYPEEKIKTSPGKYKKRLHAFILSHLPDRTAGIGTLTK